MRSNLVRTIRSTLQSSFTIISRLQCSASLVSNPMPCHAMPCQSPRIRIAEVASLELFYFLPDWRRRRRRNPDVTDGFGFDQLLRARRRRHLQPTQNSGTDVGVVDDDVVSSVGIPGVGIRVEEKRHRRRRQDPRRPKRHLQQRQLRVAEALDGVGVDNDVDQLVQLHVDDVTAAEATEFPTP